MKRALILITLAYLLQATFASAGERRLHGQILRLDEESHQMPVEKNIKVVIDEIGATNYTEENGLFDYFLRDRDRPGKEITFRVGLDDHVIHEPMDGQMRIPKDSELDQLLRLLIVKKGSQALKSDARFRKTIDVGTAEARDQVKPNKNEQAVKVTLDLTAAASKLGFTDEEFRQWIIEQAARQARSPDLQAQARAAAARNDFRKAGDLERQAMGPLEETYARARPLKQHGPPWPSPTIIHLVSDSHPLSAEELEQLALELVNGYQFAGDAYYNAYEFKQALESYQRAARYISKEDFPKRWALIQVRIGLASSAIGMQTEGAAIHQYLNNAVTAYQAAAMVMTKEAFPLAWAKTQYLLGNVLVNQGMRTSGETGIQFFVQAVEAYKTSLSIITKDALPDDWADIQNGLGNVRRAQGERISGETGTQFLAQAVEAYRAALTVHTKEAFPLRWAIAQNNLGNVLSSQGTRTGNEANTQLLDQAIEAYRAALTIYTKNQLPQAWAETENNLGNVLRTQGTQTDGETGTLLLTQAMEAHRAALTVFTKEMNPQGWASAQNNLGNVLFIQGRRTDGKAGTLLLAQAAEAYHAALTVRTKEQLPQDWAMTQHNLGNVLHAQGTRIDGETSTQLLTESVAAYRAALTVYTKDTRPQDWAWTQNRLGITLREQGMRTDGQAGVQLFAQAAETFRSTLTVYTKKAFPHRWAETHRLLRHALRLQSIYTAGEAGASLLHEAMASCRQAQTIYTRETEPAIWNSLQHDLIDDQYHLGNMLKNAAADALEEDRASLLKQAISAYREALTMPIDVAYGDGRPTVGVSSGLIEALFLNSQFMEASHHLEALHCDMAGYHAMRLVMLPIAVANSVALGASEQGDRELSETSSLLSHRSEPFYYPPYVSLALTGDSFTDFRAFKIFIETNSVFRDHRHWLNDLIEAVMGGGRDELQAAIQKTRDALRKIHRPKAQTGTVKIPAAGDSLCARQDSGTYRKPPPAYREPSPD